MKVVLATSPHVRHVAVLQSDFQPDASTMYSFVPLGLLSLAAQLRRERPQVGCEVFDVNRAIQREEVRLSGALYDDLARQLESYEADVVGFMTECDSYHHVLQICAALKQRAPRTQIVLGGPHASVVARATLERWPQIDAIVIGEGEQTFIEFLDELDTLRRTAVAGVAMRGPQGEILFGSARPLVASLDDLPIPAYDLYQPDPNEEIFVEAGRGCPFQCAFCSTAPYWQRRHRVKSPERIVTELKLIQATYGRRRVHFTHDLFTANRTWVEAVCHALIGACNQMSWTCSARTDTVDAALLRLMAQAGCCAIYFGLESGSPRLLRWMKKDIPLAESFAAIEACKEAGITPNVGFIVGFPVEDLESLAETFDAYERALRAGARPAHIFAFCPFVGASVFGELKDLRFSGHVVDLPLGEVSDHANRKLLGSDFELFGAYFRPNLPAPLDNYLPALDEFSPLVEAALAPSLNLADQLGGLLPLFERWLRWIWAENAHRGAAKHRHGYGTPYRYARFLLQHLEASTTTPPSVLSAARFFVETYKVSEGIATTAPTTMASYRSLPPPNPAELHLGSKLTSVGVIATLALDHDPSRLQDDPLASLTERPTYLVWQRTGSGEVRLLDVNRTLFQSLVILKRASATPAEILLQRLEDPDGIDLDALLVALAEAEMQGLVAAEEIAA